MIKSASFHWWRFRVVVHLALWRRSPAAAEVWSQLSLLGMHLPMARK